VNFPATATDATRTSLTPQCVPASGSTFALGTTPVSCSATEAAGLSASASFTVTVVDTTPPAVTGTSDTVEATAASGAAATYAASATDLVDGAVAVSCTPTSGSTFALGPTSVHCTATDALGNIGHGDLTVTVVDTTPPEITVPGNITVEATGPGGASVN